MVYIFQKNPGVTFLSLDKLNSNLTPGCSWFFQIPLNKSPSYWRLLHHLHHHRGASPPLGPAQRLQAVDGIGAGALTGTAGHQVQGKGPSRTWKRQKFHRSKTQKMFFLLGLVMTRTDEVQICPAQGFCEYSCQSCFGMFWLKKL